jgi:hypothetical protein
LRAFTRSLRPTARRSALGATISTSETLSQKTVVEQGVQEITNLLKTITPFSLNILLKLITGRWSC